MALVDLTVLNELSRLELKENISHYICLQATDPDNAEHWDELAQLYHAELISRDE